jgi:hypothetical protein
MKTLFQLSLLKTVGTALAISFSLSGCYIDDGARPCVRGRGNVISETRSEQPFTGIDLRISANVFVREGIEQKVEVEGYETIVRYVDTRVAGNTLIIDNDRCFRSPGTINVYVTLPELRKATVAGSGSITGETAFSSPMLTLTIPGSGEIHLETTATNVISTISGSGKIYLSGTAHSHDVRISGSGSIRAFDLSVRESEVRISGSGNCEITVRDKLDVRITGSGTVWYKGNPQVTSTISGSGRVIHQAN